MEIHNAYEIILKTADFSPSEVEGREFTQYDSEPRDLVCILLDAFGHHVDKIATLVGVHSYTVLKILNKEREYRKLSKRLYLLIRNKYGDIGPIADEHEFSTIRKMIKELGLTEEEVRSSTRQGQKNTKIRNISILYIYLKNRVRLKIFEDFTGTSHTSVRNYIKNNL